MVYNYYLVNKLQLVREFDQAVHSTQSVFVSHYGPGLSESMLHQTRQEFEALLFHLPYIGGDQNPLTRNLVQSAWFLALYRVLKSYGKPVEEVGELSYEITEEVLNGYPKFLDKLLAQWRFSRFTLARAHQRAAESQRRQYPGDWVFTFVKGDGKTFDYGIDYTECGICKFYHSQDADELTPYICLLDYPISAAMGTGLSRTTTLGGGHQCCDFRYKRGRTVPRARPPESIHG